MGNSMVKKLLLAIPLFMLIAIPLDATICLLCRLPVEGIKFSLTLTVFLSVVGGCVITLFDSDR